MQTPLRPNLMRWAIALLCAPLVLLLIEMLRGATHEVAEVRTRLMLSELNTLRADAQSRAKGLEVLIDQFSPPDRELSDALTEPPIQKYWSEIHLPAAHRLYAAVVDRQGAIIAHTNPALVGLVLDRNWYDARLEQFGPGVAATRASALSPDRATYDVAVPIASGGEYHEGLEKAWLDQIVTQQQRSTLVRWAAVLAVAVCVGGGAVWSLIYLSRFPGVLLNSLVGENNDRALALSQIGSGLAHEVRNPLHALRMNLHTLRRALGGRSLLPPDQLMATIDDSDGAIDRLDELMRDFLQYSDVTAGSVAQLDLVQELQATLRLLSEDFRRDAIQVNEQLTSEPQHIAMDPNRLKQTLLNLLTFAQHRAGKKGVIDVEVSRQQDGVELTVGNSGPVLTDTQRQQLFKPFQAPAETGSGLGLALVKVFAEEVGGRVSYEAGGPGSSRCRLWIPLDGADS